MMRLDVYCYGDLLFQNRHGLLSLEICDVVPDDAGLYSVKTTNADGEAACSASLDVYGQFNQLNINFGSKFC